MTVAELIEELKGMPQDAPVIYRCCSDYAELNREVVRLVLPTDRSIVWRPANGYSDYHAEWGPPGEGAEFRTVCVFPGN